MFFNFSPVVENLFLQCVILSIYMRSSLGGRVELAGPILFALVDLHFICTLFNFRRFRSVRGGVPIVVKALSICIQAQTKSAFLQKLFLSNFSIFYLLKISSWRLGNVDRMDQVPGDVRRRERNKIEAM